ncbi:MAG: NAD(+) synthase [bacterium]|nr:NAD(+) synthase [bacterium]
MDYGEEKDRIVLYLREKLKEEKRDGFIFGLSGGIDSTVTAYLLKDAVGKDKILALIMPELDSDPSSKKDALLVARALGIRYKVLPITEALRSIGVYREVPLWILLFRGLKIRVIDSIYEQYTKLLDRPLFFALKDKVDSSLYWFNRSKAYYGIKHRIRMAVLYFYGEKENYLVVGCTNLTERLIGFYVRYGDDASDIAPISHLYKTEVIELARFLGVPERIIEKAPSPDLIPGITDEKSFGMSYKDVDLLLEEFENGKQPEDIESKIDKKLVNLLYEQYKWVKEQEKKPWRLDR